MPTKLDIELENERLLGEISFWKGLAIGMIIAFVFSLFIF